MNRSLNKLIDAARQAHSPAESVSETAPHGFASRVVANANLGEGRRGLGTLDLLERLGWCGASTSALICLLAFAIHAQQPAPNPFDVLIETPGDPLETR